MEGLYSLLFYSTETAGEDVSLFRTGRGEGQRIAIREKETIDDLESWIDLARKWPKTSKFVKSVRLLWELSVL
jgi:hypothetical protein